MLWTVGFVIALLAAGDAAPSHHRGPKTSASVNMTQEGHSEAVPIETTTQNIFGDVISVTPPDSETIELQHLNEDTRFYPDYGDVDPVSDDHFTEGPQRPKGRLEKTRTKRQTLDTEYTDLTEEMYGDSLLTRKRREQPYKISLDIPDDSLSDSSTDSDSVSTEITYVIISEDDSSSDEAEATTEASSRQRSSERERRQIPYYRLPEVLNYRIGRSVSETESGDLDDTEPDLSMDGTDLKHLYQAPLPEYSYAFSELMRPSSTYVDGKLANYFVPDKHESKRSLDSTEKAETEISHTTEGSVDIVTASYPLGIDATKDNLSLPEGNFLGPRIYAKGDLVQEEQAAETGIIAPMEKEETVPVLNGSERDTVYSAPINNLNLPLIIPVVGPTSHPGEEPRIELSVPSGYVPYIIQLTPGRKATLREATTEHHIIPQSSTHESVAISKRESLSTFLPHLSTAPTLTTDENRIQASQGDVASAKTDRTVEEEAQQQTAKWESASNIPTAGMETVASQPTAGWESASAAPAGEEELPKQQTAKWVSASNIPTAGLEAIPSQPTAGWVSASAAPAGEEELPKQQTAKWESASNIPTAGMETVSSQPTAEWKSPSAAPAGEEELPKQQTAKWESASNIPTARMEAVSSQPTAEWKSASAAPVGEEELPKQQTAKWESASNIPTAGMEAVSSQPTGGWELASAAPAGDEELLKQSTARQQFSSNIMKASTVSISDQSTAKLESKFAVEEGEFPNDQSAKPETASSVPSEEQEIPSTRRGIQQYPPKSSEPESKRTRNEVIPILERNSVMSPNGSFSYSFKSGNGIQVQESGYLKKDDAKEGSTDNGVSQAVQGSYSYTAPDGRLISVRYVADEKGFRPEVEDLPN